MAEIENQNRSGSGETTHLLEKIATLEQTVSALTAANEKLEKEKRFFDVILDTIEAMVIVINPQGRVEYANRALKSNIGYPTDEINQISVSTTPTLSDEEKVLYAERIRRMVAGERPMAWENWGTCKDGSKKMMSWNSTVTLDVGDNLEYIFSSGIDITGRIEAENALKESEERYRELFANASDFIYTHDLEGRFTSINKTFTDTLGYSQEDVLGKSVEMVVPPEYIEIARENTIRKVKGEAVSTKYEIEIVGKAGQRFTVELNTRLIHENDRPVGVQGIGRDMTERKRAEKELRAAKDMADEATRLKDKLVTLVAHDMKSPLTGVHGLLQHILARDEGELPDYAKQSLNQSVKSCEKMIKLSEDLVDLGMLRVGKIKPVCEVIDAWPCVIEAISGVEQNAFKKGVSFVNMVPEHSFVFADSKLLARVIQNLLANAVKFSKPGGAVTVFIPEGSPSTIAVKDTGVGIRAEKITGLFEYTGSVSTTGTGGERGTGMGLPLSYEIVKAMGGNLRVESQEGKGSVFFIDLRGSDTESGAVSA
jgi:PAS domain S-box-containing protein